MSDEIQKVEEAVAAVSVEGGAAAQEEGQAAAAAAEPAVPRDFEVTDELMRRFQIARSVGEECIQDEELLRLLAKKPEPVCYDGFEPSGRMHIAQGVMKSINVNKLTSVGCKFVFWVADWFALLNNKMDGDLKKIQTVGRYMIEVWKACGMDKSKVVFLWSSEEINKNPNDYWMRVLDISRKNTVTRLQRCAQIMGRQEGGEMPAAQILYPCMQCADIFFLKADICQLGLDQRKVNVLAREYCTQAKIKNKPVILSHKMLAGLKEGQEKMSKSDPDSAIFMEDTPEEVNAKIKKAFCPPGVVDGNPILEYARYVILPKSGQLEIKRSADNGGDKVYTAWEELRDDFVGGNLHPGDVKPAVARAINAIIQPVRDHFASNPEAKKLLETVRKYRTTR